MDALYLQLAQKKRELSQLLSTSYGWGDFESLDPKQREGIESEVQDMIDQHEDALMEGETPEEWHALDEKLAETEVGRLLQQIHEIGEEITCSEDDPEDDDE